MIKLTIVFTEPYKSRPFKSPPPVKSLMVVKFNLALSANYSTNVYLFLSNCVKIGLAEPASLSSLINTTLLNFKQ